MCLYKIDHNIDRFDRSIDRHKDLFDRIYIHVDRHKLSLTGSKDKPPSPSSASESLVIQKYLQGQSMNQISKETSFSKGKVHYLIKDWKEGIGG